MKKYLILLYGISLLLLSSCNFKDHPLFKKSSDSLLDMTVEEPEPIIVDTTAFAYEEPEPMPVIVESEPQTRFGYGSSRYYMIVGSFQNQNLAVNYADKMQDMGYETHIIESSNGFFRVSAKTYNNYQQGINDIDNFRATVTSSAWLHVKH